MNSELIFLPTPNWFISRPVDVNRNNSTIATCAINSILLTNNLFGSNLSTIKDAHTKRLHGVSFLNIRDSEFLASCSEDLDIKVWNYNTRILISQHKLHQNSPTCIDWLRLEIENKDPVLLSCDVKGNIFKWNVNTGEHVRYFPENKPITQIKCLINSYKTAVGYKTGTIVLLDVKTEQLNILHKFKNHEDSINCLLWCPLNSRPNEPITLFELEGENTSHVLACSSEDKTIRLFCTQKYIQLKCFKVPSTGSKSGQSKPNQINYTSLCWPKPNILLTGSFKGDLYYVNLDNLKGISSDESLIKWNQFTNLQESHKKIIFDIIDCGDKIVTLSLDRLLNTWDLETFKQVKSMTTLNGFVYSIVSSPIDPNFMAVAVGDSSIKFLNEKSNVKSFSNNIKSEVTQVAWHPSKESIIAFGTKDGKVGIADIMSTSKPANYIFTNYNQSVYTLLWCEDLLFDQEDETTKKFNLYSVADGKIMQHDVKNCSFSKETISPESIKSLNFYKSLNTFIEESANENTLEYGLTEFSVLKIKKTKGFFFCIGKFDGSIELYKSENRIVVKLGALFNHQKLVTCIKWNTDDYDSDLDKPIYLASGSNDFNIIIIDFKQLIQDIQSSDKPTNYFSKYVHKLTGHKERITCVSWCKSSGSNLIASCSYDSTVQIWNAVTGEPIANYRNHCDKLLCCLFSSDDQNVVFSGGEDYCLHKWKINVQTFKTPPEECKILFGKKKTKMIKKQISNKKHEQDTNTLLVTETQSVGQEIKEILKFENEDIQIETKTLETNQKILKLPAIKSTTKQIKPQEIKSLFSLSSTGNKTPKVKLNDCLILYSALYDDNKIENIDLESFNFDRENLVLNLFCNRLSALQLLKLEEIELKRLNYEKWWIFEIWKGNLYKIIKHFREANQMNDLMINLYQSMICCSDPDLLELTNAYIEQMCNKESSGNLDLIHKSVLYCCASYQIEKAVDIYLNFNLYQYALCLAQIRLFPHNETIRKILIKYALYSTQVGDYETSVLCYIRLSDFENAYKILLRRNAKSDPEFEANIKLLLEKISKHLS